MFCLASTRWKLLSVSNSINASLEKNPLRVSINSGSRFKTEHIAKSVPLSQVAESKESTNVEGAMETDFEEFYKNLFLIQVFFFPEKNVLT